jgi:hypothetical protein
VLQVNVIGAAFAVAYLAVFFAFSVSKVHTGAAIAGVLAVCAAVYGGISLPASLPHDQKASIMGSVAVACNVFLFASPLAQVGADRRTVLWFGRACNAFFAPRLQMRIALVTFDPGAIPMLLVAVRSLAARPTPPRESMLVSRLSPPRQVGTATSVLWGFYGILISNWFVAGESQSIAGTEGGAVPEPQCYPPLQAPILPASSSG